MITRRNECAIRQYAKRHDCEARVPLVLDTLRQTLPLLGTQSHGRAMINRIGIALLQEQIRIITPSCPDYSHANGKYNFHTVGDGVPLLTQVHTAFLDTILPLLPHAQCEIVVADQEADDGILCHRVNTTRAVFLERIHASIEATRRYVADRGWTVHAMTKRFPDLHDLEVAHATAIADDRSLQARIRSDTIARSAMYRCLGIHTMEDMIQRTIRTAAQYSALATIAARDTVLICNHETVNLGWYNRHHAAVLHNPISVY